ncbi:hypothetical protein [Elongatibacter sediminis]|uniref:DUF1269 domain-containing protein n=1 Tax=Elongatibacter sediminis TaxID=3119006 RepID=A0AAW9RBN5_9GAMM
MEDIRRHQQEKGRTNQNNFSNESQLARGNAMKCMYYLAPNLVSTQQVSDDLHDVGINDWLLHVVSKDEAGLKKEKLHSSNWLETTDLLRDGFIGANFGFIGGVLLAGAIMLLQPFGGDLPGIVYFFVVIVATLFGAWVGGLTGIDSENRKLRRFHDEIEAGKYLILIYAPRGMGERIKAMMAERHPEARHVATDRQFINPFSRVERKRRKREAEQAFE